jgi:hypothetical protein
LFYRDGQTKMPVKKRENDYLDNITISGGILHTGNYAVFYAGEPDVSSVKEYAL